MQAVGSQRAGHNWMASLSFLFESGHYTWASLVVQGWRICLRIQGTWVPSEIREDPTCCRATKRVNTALQPVLYNLLLFSCSVVSDSLPPHGLQHAGFPVLHHLLRLVQTHVHELTACAREATALGSPPTTTWEQPPPSTARQGRGTALWRPSTTRREKKNNKKKIVASHTPHASSPAWWGFHLHVSYQDQSLGLFSFLSVCWFNTHIVASLVVQRLKRLPATQETWVRSLGWEDPLEKEMATHSSILAWRIPCTEEPGGLESTGSQTVGHTWVISLSLSHHLNQNYVLKNCHLLRH